MPDTTLAGKYGLHGNHSNCDFEKGLLTTGRTFLLNLGYRWFSVTMGTGIVSILLNTLPYNGEWLYWISVVIFAFNVLLFAVGSVITTLRYSFVPGDFHCNNNPSGSVYGAFPMSFATIVNMFCFVCVPAWGEWAKNFAWGMWIFDAVLSVITALSLPFLLMAHEGETQLSSMTAVWLLPIVSCVVADLPAGIVAGVLSNPQHALWTVIVSYALWGIGLPLAMMVMAVIVSVFLPLGPLSQGGFGILKLGKAARTIFPQTHTLQASSGDVFYTVGFLVTLILWAFALIRLFFALAFIVRCKSFPFNIGWWGFTFPLGLPSEFFRILGIIVSLCVVVLWVVVSVGTLKGVVSGQLFVAPCLANLRIKGED
ncbi:voltage-dependent anion channel [Aspergillus sergii]|uniref:Voltage-dependent anion channel n=1 Tax=Aspergillus sergii TaxID=1034303 RepID=A0A5N6WZI7_9EURO|nr:voltage-dependent anion channel [Aspergillus sergii]